MRSRVGNVSLMREALANVELEISRMIPFDLRYDLVIGVVRAVKSAFFRRGIYKDGANPLLWLGKESGVRVGDKNAVCHAAGIGSIWAADPGSPFLQRIPKRRV